MVAAVTAHNRSIARQNCLAFLKQNEERMVYFARRIVERGQTPQEILITCIMVDDPNGGPLAEALMPGYDWQPIRDQGQTPVARGLAVREGIQELLDKAIPEAGRALRDTPAYAILVVAYGQVIVVPQEAPPAGTVWDRLRYNESIF